MARSSAKGADQFAAARCPVGWQCETGRAGRTRLRVRYADPRESGHEVPMVVLASPPVRGVCFVVLRPLLRRHSILSRNADLERPGRHGSGTWLRDLDGDAAVELVIPRELELGDDGDQTYIDLIHPYALVDGELVLRPAAAAAWYEDAARVREADLARERAECAATSDGEERSRCEARAERESHVVRALRHAPACTGSEWSALRATRSN